MRESNIQTIRQYYYLAKPHRTITNVITAAAGFLFASAWDFRLIKLLELLAGTTLVIASACIFNNITDRQLDRKMARTKDRALAAGKIPLPAAVVFGTVLLLAGVWALTFINWLTVAVILTGFFSYVVVYGLAKRRTMHSTLIGTVPGAAALVAGYTAVTSRLDATAAVLFLLMLSWQMVHFCAIAIYRFDDYKNAGMPTIASALGIAAAKKHMLFYLSVFVFAALGLSIWGDNGFIGLAGLLALGAIWLKKGLAGFKAADNHKWAKDMFRFSLVVVTVMSVILAIGSVLP